jgi:hypothetical protein
MENNESNGMPPYRRRHERLGHDERYLNVRQVLNLIFMIGGIVGVILFFTVGRTVGVIVILAAMVFKIIECVLRMIP